MQENMTYFFIIGAVVVALAALAALVNYVISIVHGFRRDPPLPEEMAKGYATKRELAGEVEELKGEIAELKQENKEERQRVDAILSQLFDLLRKQSSENTERFHRLEAAIQNWQKGVDNWQLGIERMIGRIEGKVDKK